MSLVVDESRANTIKRYANRQYDSTTKRSKIEDSNIQNEGQQIHYNERFATSVDFTSVDDKCKDWMPGAIVWSIDNGPSKHSMGSLPQILIDREQFSKIARVSSIAQLNARLEKTRYKGSKETELEDKKGISDIAKVLRTKATYEVRYESSGDALDMNNMDNVKKYLKLAGPINERATPDETAGITSFGPILANGHSASNTTSIVHEGSSKTTQQWSEHTTMLPGEIIGFIVKPVSVSSLPDTYTADARKVFNSIVKNSKPESPHQRDFRFVTIMCIIPVSRSFESEDPLSMSLRESFEAMGEDSDEFKLNKDKYLNQPPLKSINYKEWRVGPDGLLYIDPVTKLPQYALKSGMMVDLGFVEQMFMGDQYTEGQETSVEQLELPTMLSIMGNPMLEINVQIKQVKCG